MNALSCFLQSSYSACFLVPQEAARLRELLESLKDFGIPVNHQFVMNGVCYDQTVND